MALSRARNDHLGTSVSWHVDNSRRQQQPGISQSEYPPHLSFVARSRPRVHSAVLHRHCASTTTNFTTIIAHNLLVIPLLNHIVHIIHNHDDSLHSDNPIVFEKIGLIPIHTVSHLDCTLLHCPRACGTCRAGRIKDERFSKCGQGWMAPERARWRERIMER